MFYAEISPNLRNPQAIDCRICTLHGILSNISKESTFSSHKGPQIRLSFNLQVSCKVPKSISKTWQSPLASVLYNAGGSHESVVKLSHAPWQVLCAFKDSLCESALI